MEISQNRLQFEKKYLSRIGFSLFALFGIDILAQLLVGLLAGLFAPWLAQEGWFLLLMSSVCMYGIGMPLAYRIIRKVPRRTLKKGMKFTGRQMFCLFLMCYCLCWLGSLLGNAVSSLLGLAAGHIPQSSLETTILGSAPWVNFLIVVAAAPLVEELFFRKLLIGRLIRYGEWPAVLLSGLLFGLFHGNFYQFFYAFALGAAFGYLYVKTGNILYPIVLHALINFNGSLLAPLILLSGNFVLLSVYSLVLLAFAIAGGVLLIRYRKRISFSPRVLALPEKRWMGIVLSRPGFIAFLCPCVLLFAASSFLF